MTPRCVNLEDWQVRAALDGRLRALLLPVREQPVRINGGWLWSDMEYRDDSFELMVLRNNLVATAPIRSGCEIVGRECWYVDSLGQVCYAIDNVVSGRFLHSDQSVIGQIRSPAIMPAHFARWHWTCSSLRAARTTELLTAQQASDLGCVRVYEWSGPIEPAIPHWWDRKFGKRHGLWADGPWAYLVGLSSGE